MAALQVIVVANPANTNALILKENSTIPAKNITALTRLDHNRALGQVHFGQHVVPQSHSAWLTPAAVWAVIPAYALFTAVQCKACLQACCCLASPSLVVRAVSMQCL